MKKNPIRNNKIDKTILTDVFINIMFVIPTHLAFRLRPVFLVVSGLHFLK